MLLIARKQNAIQDKSAYFTIFIGIILVGVVVAYNFDDFSAFATHIPPNPNSNGNPDPHHPHDTLIGHVQDRKDASFKPDCNGGHSFHIGALIDKKNKEVLELNPVNITISMRDWTGLADGLNETSVIDCDARALGDNTISIRIGDRDPDKGEISTQSWYLRLRGMPNQNFVFNTFGNTTISCDATTGCEFNTFAMGHVDIFKESQPGEDCERMTFKTTGKKTSTKSFCDITKIFLVDLDVDGDGMFGEDGLDGLDDDGDGLNGEDPGPLTDALGTAIVYTGTNNDDDCAEGAAPAIHFAFGDSSDAVIDVCFDEFGMPNPTLVALVDEDDLDDGFGTVFDPLYLVGPACDMSIDQDCDGLDGEDPPSAPIHIFAVSCVDDPATEINETIDVCPLGSSIWDIQEGTGTPTIQIFVVHDTMDVKIKGAKGARGHDCGENGPKKFCPDP